MSKRILAGGAMALGCAAAVALWGGCSPGGSAESAGAPALTNAPMVIEPNLGVGQVRAGMTVQEVIAALGPPQRRLANAIEYPRLGMAIMPADGLVQVVMCGDVMGLRGPYVKAFTGRTKEGIGMLSTRDEIIKAYGEPGEKSGRSGGLESLKYPTLGITFALEGNRVHHMIVRLRSPQTPPPGPSVPVTLEPAPAAAPK